MPPKKTHEIIFKPHQELAEHLRYLDITEAQYDAILKEVSAGKRVVVVKGHIIPWESVFLIHPLKKAS